MEQFTWPGEGQPGGQKTAATHARLRALSCAGKQQDDQPVTQLSNAGARALRALRAEERPLPIATGRIRLNAPYSSSFLV